MLHSRLSRLCVQGTDLLAALRAVCLSEKVMETFMMALICDRLLLKFAWYQSNRAAGQQRKRCSAGLPVCRWISCWRRSFGRTWCGWTSKWAARCRGGARPSWCQPPCQRRQTHLPSAGDAFSAVDCSALLRGDEGSRAHRHRLLDRENLVWLESQADPSSVASMPQGLASVAVCTAL